jgi:hypothetical protein
VNCPKIVDKSVRDAGISDPAVAAFVGPGEQVFLTTEIEET